MSNLNMYERNSFGSTILVDSEVAQKMIKNYNYAIRRLDALHSELSSLEVSNNLPTEINLLKPMFNKYVIMGCDCSFGKNDEDLIHVLSQIEMCYKVLLGKEHYNVGDILYMYNTITNAKEFFESKLEELESLYLP